MNLRKDFNFWEKMRKKTLEDTFFYFSPGAEKTLPPFPARKGEGCTS